MSDPIVEQVHKARAEILSDFGGDVRAYVDALKRRQHGKRVKSKSELVTKPIGTRAQGEGTGKKAK